MTRKFQVLAIMMSVLFVLSSCLKDETNEIIYPSDSAITSFVLGTMKCYKTIKKSDGKDSVYISNITGSSYKFNIDQVNRQIYNPDSLPYGTDVAHVACTIGTKNSSMVAIKKINSDTLQAYYSTDSIDFTVPRKFQSVSLDGKNVVEYTVTLNVHKEKPDSFIWHAGNRFEAIVDAKGMKALNCNGNLFLFVSYGQSGAIFCNESGQQNGWKSIGENLPQPVPADAYRNVVCMDGYLYLYTNDVLLRSDDGLQWESTPCQGINRLVAAGTRTLFAYNFEGKLVSSIDQGMTWSLEPLDNDGILLPDGDVSYCCLPSLTNSHVENVVLIGNRSLERFSNDAYAHVWSGVFDTTSPAAREPWMYINNIDRSAYFLPRLSSLTAVAYGRGIIAAGAAGIGACQEAGFKRIYYSYDGGIYWLNNSNYYLPTGFECSGPFTMTVDDHDYLWLFCAGSGQVWKGRLGGSDNSDDQKIFTK